MVKEQGTYCANGEEAAYWVRQFMLYGRPVLLNGQSSDVVFPSQRAQQMTRQTFWHRVKHYAILADIDADALSLTFFAMLLPPI